MAEVGARGTWRVRTRFPMVRQHRLRPRRDRQAGRPPGL